MNARSSSSALSSSPASAGSGGQFATTQWTVALAAGRAEGETRREAFGSLFALYWQPLYAYLRRSGCAPDEAEETVQGFFARLLEKGDLARIAPEKGKFRSFLLASLKHYLANERDRERAEKRGGGRLLSLDVAAAENRYAAEPPNRGTPADLFEREWALAALERAGRRLREEAVAAGNERRFDRLEGFLGGAAEDRYQDAAADLGLSENAVKATVARLRRRFGELLRDEIAPTVERTEEIDEEIRDLLAALQRS